MDNLIYRIMKHLRQLRRAAYRWWNSPHPKNWRTEVMRATHFRFPTPPTDARKKRADVNKLGHMFYNKKFPAWVIWFHEQPDNLYINTDMLVELINYARGTSAHDELAHQVAFRVGTAIVEPKVGPKVSLVAWRRDHKNAYFSINDWLTPNQLSDIENF